METKPNRSSIIVGTLLLAAGVLTLLGQVFGPRFGSGILWPVIVIAFGLAFFAGMLVGGRSFGALAIPGSIITGIGVILFFQNLFGLWETWSYAWALIICAVGIGIYIYGLWSRFPGARRDGLRVAQVGLTLFVIFGLLFEFVFSISGINYAVNGLFWPAVVIVLGLFMLINRSFRLIRNQEGDQHNDNNLFWPVIFIGAGLLWAMVRLGQISPSQVNSLVSLWPVLIVAAGVNILLGRRLQWVNLLFGALVVAGMFYVIYNADQLGVRSRTPWGVLGVNFNDGKPVTQWVAGSGTVVEEERKISNINELILRGTGEVEIIQGSVPSLTIEAEDNLLQYILTEESSGRLTISTKSGVGFSNTRPIRYTLTVKDINAISVSGAASISSEKLETSDLKITLAGFGNVDFGALQADELTLNISGSGNINAAGEVNNLVIKISGAGSYNGSDLEAQTALVNISGVGRAVVWVAHRLEPRISGVGSISYYGDPEVIENNSGLVNVRRLGSK